MVSSLFHSHISFGEQLLSIRGSSFFHYMTLPFSLGKCHLFFLGNVLEMPPYIHVQNQTTIIWYVILKTNWNYFSWSWLDRFNHYSFVPNLFIKTFNTTAYNSSCTSGPWSNVLAFGPMHICAWLGSVRPHVWCIARARPGWACVNSYCFNDLDFCQIYFLVFN